MTVSQKPHTEKSLTHLTKCGLFLHSTLECHSMKFFVEYINVEKNENDNNETLCTFGLFIRIWLT